MIDFLNRLDLLPQPFWTGGIECLHDHDHHHPHHHYLLGHTDHHGQVRQFTNSQLVAEWLSLRFCGRSSRWGHLSSSCWQVILMLILMKVGSRGRDPVLKIDNRNQFEGTNHCILTWGLNSALFKPQVKMKLGGLALSFNANLMQIATPFSRRSPLKIFIAQMCRKISLHYEEDREHKGLVAQRFIPAA